MINKLIREKDNKLKPIWFLRQAGRHLPEYLKIRSKYKNFIEFCLSEEGVFEATLLPVKKYNVDAAILFSDILLIPHFLGQKVQFKRGVGPILSWLDFNENFLKKNIDFSLFHSITSAIKKINIKLRKEQDLIGFCGAPWTLSCYMIERGTSRDFNNIRLFLWNNKKVFNNLINKLTNECVNLLEFQFKAGASVLMIFDTWSSMIPDVYWEDYAIKPIKKIVDKLRRKGVVCPIIGFPFKCGENIIKYSYETGVDIVSIDWKADLEWTLKNINKKIITQGNLDPILLASDNKQVIESEVKRILELTRDNNHIFNVGHGLTPQTKIDNVKYVINLVRNFR